MFYIFYFIALLVFAIGCNVLAKNVNAERRKINANYLRNWKRGMIEAAQRDKIALNKCETHFYISVILAIVLYALALDCLAYHIIGG